MNHQFNSNDFEIVEVVGRSKFDQNCLVKHKNTNDYYYSITIYIKLENESDKEHFKSYTLKFINLRHPSIHSLIGFSFSDFKGEPNPTIFYSHLLKYTKFTSQLTFMNNSDSNTEKILIFLGVLTGLSFLHKNDIIIGDFNTDTILINHDLHPFLTKVGYFNFLNNQQIYPLRITPPEFSVSSTHAFSKETDIYFFGYILFSIFTGKIADAALPNFPMEFNSDLESLIKRCWESDPQLRPTSDELFEWLELNINSFQSIDQEKFQEYFQLLFGIPMDVYENLTIINKKLIRNASYNDDESAFFVGKSFLFGKNFFPRNVEVGTSFIERLNLKENPDSLYYTGYLYETGKLNAFFKQDKRKAIEYYERAAKTGSLISIEKLAKIYTSSYSLVDDEKKTKLIQYCKKLADSGNIEGLYILGTFYNDGILVEQDEKLAFDCFGKASDRGNVKATIKCGMMLRYGIGVDIDENEALNFLSKAASMDPSEGAFQYGCLLNDENSSFYNKEEAKKQFDIAAQNGHKKALKIIKSINTNTIDVEDYDYDEDEDDMNYDIQSIYFDRMKALKGNPTSVKRFSHFIYRHPRLEPDETIQMTFFKLASNLNDPIGQLKYGEFLTKSKKLSDIEKGIQLVKESADSGNIEAINLYAFFNFNNNLNHKNLKESLKYYLKSAQLNNLTGLVNAGFILQNSDEDSEIQTDIIQAARLFKKAAEMGNEIGLFHYGEALLNGEGVEQNTDEAVKMFKMASEKGDSDSMIELGTIYENGDGISKNIDEALNLYKKAAEMNNPEGMVHFASLAEKYVTKIETETFLNQLEKGDLSDVKSEVHGEVHSEVHGEVKKEASNKEEEDEKEEEENKFDLLKKLAVDYIKEAVDLENTNAMNLYGEHLLHGIGLHPDFELAIKYFKMAIENENSSAMCNYGLMYETGLGMENEKNYQKAKELYERAISTDETFGKAMYHIGLMKLNGHLYETDFGAAENYFRAAIDDDYNEACFPLGWMYERGVGVTTKNCNEAFKLYKKAAANGSVCGLIGLGKLFLIGFDAFEKNENLANLIFNYTAKEKGLNEIVFTGLCFENGESAPKDLEYAELCFKITANMNFEDGEANYRRLMNKKNSKVNK